MLFSLRILALALFAVLCVNFLSHRFFAAITPIVSTTAVVVVVIAIFIPFVFCSTALPSARCNRIQALALCAVLCVNFLSHRFFAAITPIVSTTAVVIVVIAIFIPFVFWVTARPSAITITGGSFWIQALAFFAPLFLNRLPNGFGAAITPIVFAAAIVVLVVAVAILFVLLHPTTSFAVGIALTLGVQARACLAVFFFDFAMVGLRAAVTSVPTAPAVIVVVVAVTVFFVAGGSAALQLARAFLAL